MISKCMNAFAGYMYKKNCPQLERLEAELAKVPFVRSENRVLTEENERLREALESEDICPRCLENVASRRCACNDALDRQTGNNTSRPIHQPRRP